MLLNKQYDKSSIIQKREFAKNNNTIILCEFPYSI